MKALDSVIATLNNLELGALDRIEEQLLIVRGQLEECGLPEMVEKLDACRHALEACDLEEFRRFRATMVSQLGHLRVRSD